MSNGAGASGHEPGLGVTKADTGTPINQKASDDTEALIDELLPPESITPDTVAVLTNTLYFSLKRHGRAARGGTERAAWLLFRATRGEAHLRP